MISAKLLGGLGNQLFIIASIYALAKRNNDECAFDFNGCFTPLQGNKATKYRESIYKNLNEIDISNYPWKSFYKEPTHAYTPIPYSEDLLIHDSYLQSELYFKDYKEEIRDLFYPDGKTGNNVFRHMNFLPHSQLPITTVHVRRGDYQKFPNIHPMCSIEYYKKAMEEIGESIFVIVADDMTWAKENFKGKNIYYSPFEDEIMDLALMTVLPNNLITANSSFSWWGAWLNPSKNKKVISPLEWFGKDANIDSSTIIPESWKKI